MARGRSTAEDFRLARLARTRYSLADLTLAADLATARTIAARVNAGRTAAAPGGGGVVKPAAARRTPPSARGVAIAEPETEPPLTAGQLHAAGILVAILGRLVDRYRADADPEALVAADAWLRERLGNGPLRTAVGAFVREFPARLAVPETPDPPSAIAQLLLLASLDENTAVDPFRELVDLRAVREGRTLTTVADALEGFFAGRPGFGPEGRSLVELLRQPAAAAPGSLADQLRWIRSNWAGLFGGVLDDLLDKLLVALDVLAEERLSADRAWFAAHDAGAGGPAEVYRYDPGEEERFSVDRDWMPRLVLIAKSTYVWLDQLSRRYGRDIRTLDAVPDEELDRLARWGITGLWLIGLWERRPPRSGSSGCAATPRPSPRRIPSTTTDRRGPGWRRRPWPASAIEPWPRGIRLASDMVPNHMGIDSRWVIEHPDWFLSLPRAARSRRTRSTGRTCRPTSASGSSSRTTTTTPPTRRSCSSGSIAGRATSATSTTATTGRASRGTTRPSSTTPGPRSARRSSRRSSTWPASSRSSASTPRWSLAKKHVERLWYPEPGQGGAIPSRAGHGMTRAEFDRAMPHEFWREVVDRVAAEVPGTLLLAEAFWLLEGYFVRTLGMHRVYNSAFMNMLRDETQRRLPAGHPEHPRVRPRHPRPVRQLHEQPGRADRRRPVRVRRQVLRGRGADGDPARAAHVRPRPDRGLHREVRDGVPPAPSSTSRSTRACWPTTNGRSSRSSIAGPASPGRTGSGCTTSSPRTAASTRTYSPIPMSGRAASARWSSITTGTRTTKGTIRESVGFNAREGDGERRMRRESLAEGLGLSGREDRWLRIRDAMTGLEGLRWSAGRPRRLAESSCGAYRCLVLVDLEELGDAPDRPVSKLAAELGDGWIPSIDEALLGIALRPVHAALRKRLATALAAVPATPAGPSKAVKRSKAVKPGAVSHPGTTAADPARRAAILATAVSVLDGEPFDDRRLWPVVADALGSAGLDHLDAERGTGVVRGLVLAGRRHARSTTRMSPAGSPTRSWVRHCRSTRPTVFAGSSREAFVDLVGTVGRLVDAAGPSGGDPDRAGPRSSPGPRPPATGSIAGSTLRSRPSSRTSRRSSGHRCSAVAHDRLEMAPVDEAGRLTETTGQGPRDTARRLPERRRPPRPAAADVDLQVPHRHRTDEVGRQLGRRQRAPGCTCCAPRLPPGSRRRPSARTASSSVIGPPWASPAWIRTSMIALVTARR